MRCQFLLLTSWYFLGVPRNVDSAPVADGDLTRYLSYLNNSIESYCPYFPGIAFSGTCKDKVYRDSNNITLNDTDIAELVSDVWEHLELAKIDICVQERLAKDRSPCGCCSDDHDATLTATSNVKHLIQRVNQLHPFKKTDIACKIPNDHDEFFVLNIFSYTKSVLEYVFSHAI